jgi:hypothetical protein
VITPRIYRRSLRKAMQWRLLFLWWASLLVPGAIAAMPVAAFLGANLDHSTRANDIVAWMDGSTVIDLLHSLGDSGAAAAAALRAGTIGAVLTLLFIAPFMAGAMVTAAHSDEPLPLQRLLAGAGEMYGRMLRTALCGLLPLALGVGLAAAAFKMASKANEHAIWERDAISRLHQASIAAAILFFVFHLLVDGARAHFSAEPSRRSAVAALWGAVRLLVRRPLRMLALGAAGSIAGLGIAALLMLLRLRVEQAGTFSIAMAWVLAQAAHVSVGWGRGARIFGLAELLRADTAERARAFRMEPPASSPPALVQSETLEALAPPLATPSSLSPPGGSGR